jgi:hypothetical protein
MLQKRHEADRQRKEQEAQGDPEQRSEDPFHRGGLWYIIHFEV